MKKVLTILFLFCVFIQNVYAQEAIGKFYKLKVETELQESTISGDTVGYIQKTISKQAIFTIVNTSGENYVIRFWNWGGSKDIENAQQAKSSSASKKAMIGTNINTATDAEKIISYNIYLDENGNWNQRYFLIPISALPIRTEEYVSGWSPSFGVATLPFKARGSFEDFTKDVSVSGLGGFKHRGAFGFLPNTDFTTLIGVGLASVTLDSANTNGTIKKSSDYAAVSFSIGEVVQWKNLQIGVFIGLDNLKENDINGWKYQGKMWWALGIGVSIFSENSSGKEGKN